MQNMTYYEINYDLLLGPLIHRYLLYPLKIHRSTVTRILDHSNSIKMMNRYLETPLN